MEHLRTGITVLIGKESNGKQNVVMMTTSMSNPKNYSENDPYGFPRGTSWMKLS